MTPPPASPTPPPAPTPRPAAALPPRPIIKDTSRRDTLLAVVAGIVVLALIAAGIWGIAKVPGSPSTNQLTGIIVAKHNAGEVEKEITFGKKGLHSQVVDTGYTFEVKTEPEGRVYEVPVPRVQYDMYQVGAKYKFIRPPSEQH